MSKVSLPLVMSSDIMDTYEKGVNNVQCIMAYPVNSGPARIIVATDAVVFKSGVVVLGVGSNTVFTSLTSHYIEIKYDK